MNSNRYSNQSERSVTQLPENSKCLVFGQAVFRASPLVPANTACYAGYNAIFIHCKKICTLFKTEWYSLLDLSIILSYFGLRGLEMKRKTYQDAFFLTSSPDISISPLSTANCQVLKYFLFQLTSKRLKRSKCCSM